MSFIHLQDLLLTLPGLSFLRIRGLRGGGLAVPSNLKLNNSAKKYYSLKRVGRNIVLSIINQNVKKILTYVNSVII